jgi:hypothetical protein
MDAVNANGVTQLIVMAPNVWKLPGMDSNHHVKKAFNAGKAFWEDSQNVIWSRPNVSVMNQRRCPLFSIKEGSSDFN